jgi:hypothetical protein
LRIMAESPFVIPGLRSGGAIITTTRPAAEFSARRHCEE